MAARSSVVPATRTGVGPRISNGRANPQVWRGGDFSRSAGASRVKAAIGAPVCYAIAEVSSRATRMPRPWPCRCPRTFVLDGALRIAHALEQTGIVAATRPALEDDA